MKKMWSGRFREPLDPEFESWQRSFGFDRRLLADEIAASSAYARALGRATILSSAEEKAVLDGLQAILARAAKDPAFLDKPEVEDVHQFVEQELVALIGDTGFKLHSGRSRNEQIATDLRLFTRRSIDEVRASLADLIEALLVQAEQHAADPMPSYTHLQRAEPMLIGHWLMAFGQMFLRDGERFADCRRRVNVLPLGSGAVAGPGVELDREQMARDLGFQAISGNSVDVTSDRDFELEFMSAAAMTGLHLSRLAEELALFATTEYSFVRLPEAYSTGSSAMPQKKNPDALELLRGKVGRLLGAYVSLAVVVKGLPLAYNKDMQEAQEPLFQTADTLLSSLRIAAGCVRKIEFDTGRLRAAASSGFLNATAAARYLMRRGVPFRKAHETIGHAVRLCLEKGEGCELENLTIDELRGLRPEFEPDFYDAVKLDAVIKGHNVPGGTAPERVRETITSLHDQLEQLRLPAI